ncbi:MAG: hypothetical protein BVN29_10090 [Nitrospira sp. ST-bin5]|nr:MAG: hypothetical protein BVN29_10090 [Nitrospira sp. ST-bin5]
MNTASQFGRTFGLVLGLSALFCGSLTAAPASADLLHFSFQGTISSVGGQLQPTLNNTHVLSGFFTIDSDTPGAPAGANTTQYMDIFKSLTLSLGPSGGPSAATASMTTTPGTNFLSVQTTGGPLVQYAAQGQMTGSTVEGRTPVSFEFDGNANAGPPSISSFVSNQWRLVFSGTGSPKVIGTLTSLTAVPLPAAVVLFGAGLVALAGLGAGSRRRQTARSAS